MSSCWGLLHSHLLSFGVGVEIIWPDVFAKHHIIIEVNELLGESWDAVDVGFNGRGAESGKVAVILEDVLHVKEKYTNIPIKKEKSKPSLLNLRWVWWSDHVLCNMTKMQTLGISWVIVWVLHEESVKFSWQSIAGKECSAMCERSRLKFYLMCDNCNSGIIQVEPGGNLSVSDDEDVSHPGGVSLNRAQWIAELLVVLKSTGWHIFILFGLKRGMRKNI